MPRRNDLNYAVLQLRVTAVEAAYSRLVRQHDELVTAVTELIRHVSPQPDGALSGMADHDKRLAWYEALIPIRGRARAAVTRIKGET